MRSMGFGREKMMSEEQVLETEQKNTSLIKRVGYLLEKYKNSSFGLTYQDYNYVHLDYHHKKNGKKDTTWRVIL